MSPKSKNECPACGTSADENESICPGCGTVLEEDPKNETEEYNVPLSTEKTVDAEEDEGVIAEEPLGESSEEEIEKTEANEEMLKKREKAPTLKGPNDTEVNRVGTVIYLLGALGVMVGTLQDPLMNIIDSSHPATITMGAMQLAVVLISAIVMVAGFFIMFFMPKKSR